MTAIPTSSSYRTTAVRPGPIGLIVEAIRESWSRRRLIRYLVQADLKKKGSDTLLGNIWWILDPLLQMFVYVVLVALIFERGVDDYPLFIFAAILPWKWFTSSVGDAIVAVTSQDRLIKQVHFPKIVLPFAVTTAGLVNFAFGLLSLAGLLVILFRERITLALILIPLVALVQYVFTLACTFLFAAINVFYRDVGNLTRHLLRLWFYVSPGLYSLEQLHKIAEQSPVLTVLINANPWTILFSGYRAVIYDGRPPDWLALGALLAASLLLLAFATYVFKRLEPSFAKVL